MGASVSTNQQTITNNMITNATNSCPTISTVNAVNISGLNYSQPPNCPAGSGFNINQAAVVDATCLLTSLQNTAAQVAQSLSADAQAGLGISVSTNVSDIETSIAQNTTNTCTNTSTRNVANIADTTIRSCNFTLTQNATENVSCQINATQGIIDKIATQSAATAKGGSIFGDLFGGGIGGIITVIVIIIVLAVVAGVAFYFLRGKKGSGTTTASTSQMTAADALLLGGFRNFFNDINNPVSFNDKLKKNSSFVVLIILILIVLIVFLMSSCKKSNKQLTDNDIGNLNQTITEAHQIADFNSKPNVSKINYYDQPNHINYDSESLRTYNRQQNYGGDSSLNDFYKTLV
jgi:flagellar basal body-associated protein FliL